MSSSVADARPSEPLVSKSTVKVAGLSFLVVLFLLALLPPMSIQLGPIRLSPYRILLLLLLVPLAISYVTGKAGKILLADIFFFLHVFWVVLSLIVVHGVGEGIQPAGIYAIEFVGAYLLARVYIRSSHQFDEMVRWLVFILWILLPLALFEALTGAHPVQKIFNVYIIPVEPRWGLDRAMATFEHPILYGVFAASAFTLTYYLTLYKSSIFKTGVRTIPSVMGTFFALSSGPLLSLILQMGMIGWEFITRRIPMRWTLLFLMFVMMYIAIDLLSNRKPVQVFVTYMTFSVQSAYTRITIWDFGFAEVLRHPYFGIGFNDWLRPFWLSKSVDNYWLVVMMRHGFPALIFYLIGIFLMIRTISARKLKSKKLIYFRKAWGITIATMLFAVCTVHLWNATFCHFVFLLGSCAWIIDEKEEEPKPKAVDNSRYPYPRRF